MATVRTSVEAKRGCGYRKPGGLYLVSGELGIPCGALPVPLSVCPTCSAGIKPTRGWTWVSPDHLLSLAPHDSAAHSAVCPLAAPGRLGERCGLLWIGEQFYKTPEDFTAEAARMGVSRRISRVPKDFELGQWVLLAHRKAIFGGYAPLPVPREEKMGEEAVYTAGIFHVFRPTAIEYIVTGQETEAELDALEKRGLSLVKVVRDVEQAELSA